MKWVILVYMAMFVQGPEVMKYTVLEFPATDWVECKRIATEINHIETAYKSKTPYVRSFHWVYNNMLDDIKAECVYANPPVLKPKWADLKKEWGVPDIIE